MKRRHLRAALLGSVLLLSAACGTAAEPQEVTELTVQDAQGLPVESLSLDTVRRYQLSTATLALENTGTRELVLTAITLPEDIAHDATLPLSIAAGQTATVTLSRDTTIKGVRTGDVIIEAEGQPAPLASLAISSEVTPYIHQQLRDMPALDAAAEQALIDHNIVGLAIGIAEGQDIVYLRGFGYADQQAGIPVDPEATMFRWASLSKGVTGMAALQASLRGEINLDAEVASFVPEYPGPQSWLPEGCEASDCALPLGAGNDFISTRMLLHHTAGVLHYDTAIENPNPPSAQTDDPSINTGIAWALDYWVHQPVVAIPGTTYDYSSFGYNLAGVAIERATESSFAELVTRYIAEPIGMDSMQPDYQWIDIAHRAVGYDLDDNDMVEPDSDTDVSWKLPSGGFISTTEDLTKWCSGLMGDVMVPIDQRDGVLWQPSDISGSYGFGFGVSGSPDDRRINHSGAQQGARSAMIVYPEQDRCIVVMSNSRYIDVWDVMDVIEGAL